jgi:hypothetical protein
MFLEIISRDNPTTQIFRVSQVEKYYCLEVRFEQVNSLPDFRFPDHSCTWDPADPSQPRLQ